MSKTEKTKEGRVIGHWAGNDENYTCTVCNNRLSKIIKYTDHVVFFEKPKYCPSCGAPMQN